MQSIKEYCLWLTMRHHDSGNSQYAESHYICSLLSFAHINQSLVILHMLKFLLDLIVCSCKIPSQGDKLKMVLGDLFDGEKEYDKVIGLNKGVNKILCYDFMVLD